MSQKLREVIDPPDVGPPWRPKTLHEQWESDVIVRVVKIYIRRRLSHYIGEQFLGVLVLQVEPSHPEGK